MLSPTTPARPFGADTLACALVLTGRATPTVAELAAALAQLYPAANGPTVADVLASGWLVPTLDGRGLREPPLSSADIAARLAAADTPDKTGQPNAPALPESRQIVGLESVFLRPLNTVKYGQTASQLTTPASIGGIENEDPAVPRFSYYRGGIRTTAPHAAITVGQLYAVLISPHARARTVALRAAPVGSPQRDELKRGLDYVTPAGTFARRANDGLETASGLLVLDFDHLPDLPAARAALLADALLAPELALLFTSPSGDGLKAFVRTDPRAAHLDNFRTYADYLGRTYAGLALCPDEAGKDVARACFVPYAPDAWLAPMAA